MTRRKQRTPIGAEGKGTRPAGTVPEGHQPSLDTGPRLRVIDAAEGLIFTLTIGLIVAISLHSTGAASLPVIEWMLTH